MSAVVLLAKDVVLSELASCEQKACSTATRNMLDAKLARMHKLAHQTQEFVTGF
jgi:hypothetical protein